MLTDQLSKKLYWLVLLCAALSANAAAAGDESRAVRKVDVDEVVAAGKVETAAGITTAGQPDEAALKVFGDSGYSAVIDLRGPNEDRGIDEKAVVEELGMSYVPLPVSGAADISFENAKALDEIIASSEGPVLVHCGSGNRAGALLALRASLKGASDDEAVEVGRQGGLTGSEGVVRERLEEKGD